MSHVTSPPRQSELLRPREIRDSFNPATWGVRTIAETAVAVALAAALGLLRVFTMPQGGSVSLEMLPILFLAARRGVGPAVVAGGLYGMVQLVLPGAVIFHPAQVALDYPLAYAAVGLAGLVRVTSWPRLAAAVAVGTAARFVFHFLSGVIFFASYAPEGWNPWLYSVTYNVLYLVPEAVISALVLWPLLKAYDAAFPSHPQRRSADGGRRPQAPGAP